MSQAALMADVHAFVGKPLLNCIDKIEASAKRNRYEVLIKGHDAPPNIDANDESRLNVRTDKDGVIVSFSIG